MNSNNTNTQWRCACSFIWGVIGFFSIALLAVLLSPLFLDKPKDAQDAYYDKEVRKNVMSIKQKQQQILQTLDLDEAMLDVAKGLLEKTN